MNEASSLQFSLSPLGPLLWQAVVTVPAPYVAVLYEQCAKTYGKNLTTYGFHKGTTPISYIQEHFKGTIEHQLQKFLFNYFVISFLYKNIVAHKLTLVGDPRIKTIEIDPQQGAIFTFHLSLAETVNLRDWRLFPFKEPKRKNYKDIDRQVETFIKQETESAKNCTNDTIEIGDWVNFDTILVDENDQPLLGNNAEKLWVCIGDEEADLSLQHEFLGKKKGDVFFSTGAVFQEYFSIHTSSTYRFKVTIHDTVVKNSFSFDDFKRHFRLKNNKDVHHKIIEVFSFRNDLSQRRSIVEEALKLLIQKHPLSVPSHILLRQEKEVHELVQENPDYHVYKNERTFKDYLKRLAAKQVRETILIDQLAYSENLSADDADIRSYLNLTHKPRTKEFLYFTPPATKVNGHELPISCELLRHNCLREKTINHLIYHLTKK